MNNRIKQLREEYLKLSQDAFGDILGVSQRTVSTFENDAKKLTDRNFNAICEKFNVNPKWLETGEGEMFLNPSTLDKLAAEYDLTPEESALIKTFAELPAEDRKPDDQLTVAEKRRIMNEEFDAEEKGQILSASTGTNGIKRSRKFSS